MSSHPDVSVDPPGDPWIGRVLDGRYRVEEPLGEGGMGAVYAAEQIRLRKRVAVKVIRPEFAGNGEVAARFAREAMASAQLEHPHVAHALDYGTLDEGGAYLVMQLVEGPNLQAILDHEGPLPWLRACTIGAQLADALSAAHARGIVHRDLKPENIVLEPRDGQPSWVRILDFGVARVPVEPAREGEGPLTRMGMVMGTPGYMAPEQALGQTVDHRADLYALGVVLWEMLMARRLFPEDDLTAIVTQQLTQPVPALELDPVEPPVPPALDRLLSRLLAREAADRPAQTTEVRDALRALSHPAAADHAPVFSSSVASSADPATAPTQAAETAVPPARNRSWFRTAIRSVGARPGRWLALGCSGLIALAAGVIALTLAASSPSPGTSADAPPAKGWLDKVLPEQLIPAPAVPPEVQQHVDTLITSDQRRERRRAAAWILNYEPTEAVPEYAQAVAGLENARGCRSKREAIADIVEVGDPKGRAALERMARTRRRGCGFLGLSDCYACLRKALDRALRDLPAAEAANTPN